MCERTVHVCKASRTAIPRTKSGWLQDKPKGLFGVVTANWLKKGEEGEERKPQPIGNNVTRYQGMTAADEPVLSAGTSVAAR